MGATGGRDNKFFFMVNPFNPGDKVLILRQGVELEATVRTTWNHEVQVRIADGELLWRTVKTARLIVAAPAVEQKPLEEPAQTVEEAVETVEPGPVLAVDEIEPEHAGEQPGAPAESAFLVEAPHVDAPEVVVLDEPQQPKDSRSKNSRKRERSRQNRKPKDGSHPF